MAEFDPSQLAPHRALEPADPRYVPRPWSSGGELAKQVLAGFDRIAVVGPAGVGKSTELAAAAAELQKKRPTVLVKMPAVSSVGEGVAAVTRAVMQKSGEDTGRFSDDSFTTAIRALAVQGGGERPVLLIDGLERIAERTMALGIVRRIHELASEADVVFVVSPMMTTGPEAYEFLEEIVSRHVFEIFPLPIVLGAELTDRLSDAGKFLTSIVARRWPAFPNNPGIQRAVAASAVISGGVIRGWLQLVHDAASFDRLAGTSPISETSFIAAVQEHAGSIRRLLRDGDVAAMQAAKGTDGGEMEIERKIRLLSHGLLLRYPGPNGTMVYPHPLIAKDAGSMARMAWSAVWK